jgi:hypothetical protein
MPSRTIVCLGLILACAALGSLRAEELVGYVLTAPQGTWSATPGGSKLVPGAPVYAGNHIDCRGCNATDLLTLAMLDGSPRPVTTGYIVPSLHDAAKPEIVRLIMAIGKSLSQEKRVLVFGISRGSLDVAPAVLKLTGRRVDVAPSMGRLAAAEYQLEFTPIEGGQALEARCNFDPPSHTSATAALSPGAYTLRVASASGAPIGNSTVLAAPAAEFDARAEEFRKGVELTASWPAGIDPQARSTFLSALLVEMASSPVLGPR